MSVVISGSLVLTDQLSGGGGIDANNPIVGWHNLVTTSAITATSAAAGFPPSNLGNPATHLRWKANVATPDQYVRIDVTSMDMLDYLAIARHNFASAQIAVSVERLVSTAPDVWAELVGPVLLPNNGPALFRFSPRVLTAVRIRMQPGLDAPTMAVVYFGKLLVLQRRIYAGHTPMPYGRSAKITNARSESGNFLGRIVLNETTRTTVSLKNLTAAWYRAQMQPFIRASVEAPFFFAWRPADYPGEVGYAWTTNDPVPQNQGVRDFMQLELELTGII